jgi:hypothetical protein
MNRKHATPVDPILAELMAIKRLIVFSLLKNGATQQQIGSALGLDGSQISRMFPSGSRKATGKTAKSR